MTLLLLLAGVVVLPLAMFGGHVVAYRALRFADREPTAHSSAIAGIAAAVGVFGLVVLALAVRGGLSISEAVGQLAYVAAAGAALGVLYLDIVNIAETSLHMHLLLRVAWAISVPREELVREYGPDQMVQSRLGRLKALGQVVERDGGLYVSDRSVLRFARVIDAWKAVLGLPLDPYDPDQ
jgi:hypothetical protein